VLDGEFNFQIGEQSFTAARGEFVLGPRHIPHGFKAVGTSPAKMLMIVSPAGFERFFDELTELTARPPFDFDKVRALFEKYGMQIIEPK
jgi:quercetin dioxygenase-like cupin family protein